MFLFNYWKELQKHRSVTDIRIYIYNSITWGIIVQTFFSPAGVETIT